MNAATSWQQAMDQAEAQLATAERANDVTGAITAATEAVTRFSAALDLASAADAPFEWAETQTRLSVALRLLGALADDVALLHDAIRSCQAALSVVTPATAPQVWGRARAALGSIYVVLGERDDDLACLATAAACYAEAIEGFPRTRFPLEWARMLRNRGAALTLMCEVANDPDALIDAVGCYRAAREAFPPATSLTDGALAEWALTHSNLGQALRLLAERDPDPPKAIAYLHDAVAACEAALDVTVRDVAPEAWAMTTTNLANALAALGARTGDSACLLRAIDAYREAIAALGGSRWLRQRAIARHNLMLAERRLVPPEPPPK
jgi:tetratricopeptide (TPR) repeat protein